MFDAEGRGGAATEVDCFWFEGIGGGSGFHLCNERVQECVIFVFGAFFEIETAVGAGFWAEWDVKIEVFNDGGLHGGDDERVVPRIPVWFRVGDEVCLSLNFLHAFTEETRCFSPELWSGFF